MWGFFKILTIKKVLYLVCRKAANSKCGENIKYIFLKVKKNGLKKFKKGSKFGYSLSEQTQHKVCQNSLPTFLRNQHVVRGLIEPHPKTHIDKKD